LKDVVVPETQDTKAAALQVCVAHLIARAFGVLAPVCFYDEHLFERDEVDNPRADGYLSTKFNIG
jgi:hypothetical protein